MWRCLVGALCVVWPVPVLAAEGVAMIAVPDVFEPDEVDVNRQWAERAFAAVPNMGGDRLTIAHDDEPGTAKVNRCAAGTPLRLGERTYTRGLGVNSNCVLRVTLAKPAARLLADIGIDRNVDGSAASAAFQVSIDGREVFTTDVMRPTGQVVPIDVALNGAASFDLAVSDGGDGRSFDQADWANARVVLEDSTELWLDDLAKASGMHLNVINNIERGTTNPRQGTLEKLQKALEAQGIVLIASRGVELKRDTLAFIRHEGPQFISALISEIGRAHV